MTVDELRGSIGRFVEHACAHPLQTFLVLEVGCGLAGFRPRQVAGLFAELDLPPNVHLPENFWSWIRDYSGHRASSIGLAAACPDYPRQSCDAHDSAGCAALVVGERENVESGLSSWPRSYYAAPYDRCPGAERSRVGTGGYACFRWA